MSSMKDREEGFERKFVFDEAYAKQVVVADIEEAGDHDVFRKIRKDFDAAGVNQSDHQIRRTMDELMAQAIEEIKNT
ncbi:MAG: DUF1476 family protein [Mesorhizobium sp.]|nr:MAG: DUF1476 family protein [Mesorhizobium sp.]